MCLDEAVIELEHPQAGLRTVVNILWFCMKHVRESLGIHLLESFIRILWPHFFFWWFENRKLAYITTKYLALVFSP